MDGLISIENYAGGERKAHAAASARWNVTGRPRDEATEIEQPMKNADDVVVATTHEEEPSPHLHWTPFYKQRTTDAKEVTGQTDST